MKRYRWQQLACSSVLVLCAWCVLGPIKQARANTVLVLGTPRPDGNYGGVLMRRIYNELFRRVGNPIEIRTLPTARLALELSNGSIDGDIARPQAFGDSQPGLVRVEEPVLEISYALWATSPAIKLTKLDQLRQLPYTVTYNRGVVYCEDLLKSMLPEQQVVDVTTTVGAIHMLHYGRNELHCGIDFAVLSDAGLPEFAGKPPLFKVLTVSKPDPMYLYLQRKHAALAAQAAITLRKMKADGTLERLRRETLREFNLASHQ